MFPDKACTLGCTVYGKHIYEAKIQNVVARCSVSIFINQRCADSVCLYYGLRVWFKH